MSITLRIEAIFVGGVPAEADETYLQQNFEKFGEIKTVKIINSVKTKKPKRFAIVTFSQPISGKILMQEHWLLGRKVDVKEYLSGEEANNKLNREKQRKVFVGGLPLTVTNGIISLIIDLLKNYFQQFGRVVEANIVYNHETMRSRGFGFVIFHDEKTVDEVLKRYDDHYLYGKWVKFLLPQIECKPALLKDEVTTTESTPQQTPREAAGTSHGHGQQMFSQGGRGQTHQRGGVTTMGGPSRGGAERVTGMQHAQMQNQDDDSDDGDEEKQINPKMTQLASGGVAGKKKPTAGKDDRRAGQDEASKPDGSDNNSQGGSQGFYDFQGGYGAGHQSPHYNYQSGYNYQMPAHPMGAQGYGMYHQGYPTMGQRAPIGKQYPYGYSYQDRNYPPMMAGKGIPTPDYYDEYNYGDQNIHGMRGGHMDPQHGHGYPMKQSSEYMRGGDKRSKPQLEGRGGAGNQFTPYQYGGHGQPMGQLYHQNVHQGHYEARGGPYDYSNNYKQGNKSDEAGMPAGMSNTYNYGKAGTGQAPYSYGTYPRKGEKSDQDNGEDSAGNFFEEGANPKGPKGKQQAKGAPRGQAGEEGAPGNANSKTGNKVSKTNMKQFAEDLDKKKGDN